MKTLIKLYIEESRSLDSHVDIISNESDINLVGLKHVFKLTIKLIKEKKKKY